MMLAMHVGANGGDFQGSYALTDNISLVTVTQTGVRQSGLFIERIKTAKAGYKYVKGVVQFGFSVPVNADNFTFFYTLFILSLGMQVTLFRDWD